MAKSEFEKNRPKYTPLKNYGLIFADKKRQPVRKATGKVEDVNDDEIVIADVRRHPIGLFLVYLEVFAGIGLSFLVIFAFLPSISSTTAITNEAALAFSFLLALLVIVLAVIFLALFTRIYNSNQLIITNEHVTQVSQVGLFHRQVSEISMANVEDVSARKKGIMQTWFNYGQVHIETAGEQNNYDFNYCPSPNVCVKAIQDARIEFLKDHGRNR